ncbi:MAG: EF-hand domain-containing protein [Thermomicrobiales bacterium]
MEPTTTSSEFDKDGDGFLTFDELRAAVAAAIPQYQWPVHYNVTVDLVVPEKSGGRSMTGDRFENGMEFTLLDGRNQCAWMKTWLDARAAGNAPMEAQALDMLVNVVPHNPGVNENGTPLPEVQRAQLGDPSLIQRFVTLNCAGIVFVDGVAATPSPRP